MKKFFLFAAAALLAACSGDDLTVKEQPQVQADPGAVAFEAYTQKATTRAGEPGTLTTSLLKTGVFADDGFGVFGYYTDNNDYEQRSTPNFFYNQQVKWDGSSSSWTYEPVKYWPNEYGDKATSDDADKVTYFAYAPWVDIIPTSGKIERLTGEKDEDYKAREQWGITGMSKNTTQGDPLVKYIASFNSNKSVDICWGVADNNDGVWPTVQNETVMDIANGTPWLNVQRPASVGQKVKFTFKHATAQMRINIDAIIDEVRQGASPKPLDDKTRIWVREVKFKGFALKGTLNLNNDDNANKPYWLDYNGQNELVAEDVAVYDGRKDGKEGVAGAIATNEKVLGLNPALIQDGVYAGNSWKSGIDAKDQTVYNANDLKVQGVVGTGGTASSCIRPGVTTTTVNLFNNAAIADEPKNHNDGGKDGIFHVIPVDENFEVEIVYDVETVSENLAQNLSDGQTKGTSIENRIRKTISFSDNATTGKKLQPGHSYTLNLHLGMNSVKFDAAVSDWIEEAAQPVDLPLNAPLFGAAAKSGSTPSYPTKPATIPYDATNYTFAINGLDGGESVEATLGTNKGKSNDATGSVANTNLTGWSVGTAGAGAQQSAATNGIAIEELTTAVNPTTSNRTQVITWNGKQSEKGVEITFTQLAHPLGLHVGTDNTATYVASTKTIKLERDANIDGTFGWMSAGLVKNCAAVTPSTDSDNNPNKCGISVKRNGVTLTWATSTTAPDTFTFEDDGNGVITLKDDIQVGDVYEVTLKTGDAPAETISIKVIE